MFEYTRDRAMVHTLIKILYFHLVIISYIIQFLKQNKLGKIIYRLLSYPCVCVCVGVWVCLSVWMEKAYFVMHPSFSHTPSRRKGLVNGQNLKLPKLVFKSFWLRWEILCSLWTFGGKSGAMYIDIVVF